MNIEIIIAFIFITFIGYVSINVMENKELCKQFYLVVKNRKNTTPTKAISDILELIVKSEHNKFLNKILRFYAFIISFDLHKEKVRMKHGLRNDECLSLRFVEKGNYYEHDDPGRLFSLSLAIADFLFKLKFDMLKTYTTRRIRKNPNDLYQRLFLAFYHLDHNNLQEALTEFKTIREINILWHADFINLCIIKFYNLLNKEPCEIIPFKKPE